MQPPPLEQIVEALIFAADAPLPLDALQDAVNARMPVTRKEVKEAVEALQQRYAEGSALELVQVASGFRFQVRAEFSDWVQQLEQEKVPRYSRAFMETLAIIAYRQPVTRGEIEDIRGVSVSSQIMRTLLDHGWIRVVGHKDVPGRPAIYATTRHFLDYFNLTGLDDLPPLAELRDPEHLAQELFGEKGDDMPAPDTETQEAT
ncbi:SMC-Scp complex subunit ScpB [Hahella sp. SMD15-11]|uniref:SMC-Scp complex subunit ScpB n=1 Tax=Thermohahella caldifontis TaxID=3142973 RepID=A0AB39UZX3_9GAMM